MLTLFALAWNARCQGPTHFTVELTSTVDPNRSFGGGTFDLNGSKLIYFLGLYGRFVAPEIHGPATPGTEAPLLFTLNESTGAADEIPISRGEFVLTPEQIRQLAAGQWYITVGGGYRGQIVPNVGCHEGTSDPIFLNASLSGDGAWQATFWLHGTLLDWEIRLPATEESYTAIIATPQSWMRRGRLITYLGTLDCDRG